MLGVALLGGVELSKGVEDLKKFGVNLLNPLGVEAVGVLGVALLGGVKLFKGVEGAFGISDFDSPTTLILASLGDPFEGILFT